MNVAAAGVLDLVKAGGRKADEGTENHFSATLSNFVIVRQILVGKSLWAIKVVCQGCLSTWQQYSKKVNKQPECIS